MTTCEDDLEILTTILSFFAARVNCLNKDLLGGFFPYNVLYAEHYRSWEQSIFAESLNNAVSRNRWISIFLALTKICVISFSLRCNFFVVAGFVRCTSDYIYISHYMGLPTHSASIFSCIKDWTNFKMWNQLFWSKYQWHIFVSNRLDNEIEWMTEWERFWQSIHMPSKSKERQREQWIQNEH